MLRSIAHDPCFGICHSNPYELGGVGVTLPNGDGVNQDFEQARYRQERAVVQNRAGATRLRPNNTSRLIGQRAPILRDLRCSWRFPGLRWST
jgi:hypothetical protein